jgi:hypothetical protein
MNNKDHRPLPVAQEGMAGAQMQLIPDACGGAAGVRRSMYDKTLIEEQEEWLRNGAPLSGSNGGLL